MQTCPGLPLIQSMLSIIRLYLRREYVAKSVAIPHWNSSCQLEFNSLEWRITPHEWFVSVARFGTYGRRYSSSYTWCHHTKFIRIDAIATVCVVASSPPPPNSMLGPLMFESVTIDFLFDPLWVWSLVSSNFEIWDPGVRPTSGKIVLFFVVTVCRLLFKAG